MDGGTGRTFTNWAQSYQCRPSRYFVPSTREHISQILQKARENNVKVRMLGRGHSPSDLPFTDDYLIVMTDMNDVQHIDKAEGTVKVEAGILIRDLNKILEEADLSLSILGSVDDITIGGAISTGTHGSGAKFGSVHTFVKELELMRADGEVVTVSRDHDETLFRAACVSLGCFGVLLSVTLQCERLFYLHKVYAPAKLDEVLDTLDEHLEACDHFRFTWYPYAEVQYEHSSRQPAKKKIPDKMYSWFWDYGVGFHLLKFLYWISIFCCRLVPYVNRFYYWIQYSVRRELADVGYRIFKFECLFNQYVEEWAIPREHTCAAMRELRETIEKDSIPAHFPVEVRFVRADDFMLSTASGRDVACINIVSYRPYNWEVEHQEYFTKFEEIMKKYKGRPHWAKDHGQTAEQFQQMYPEWKTFCELRKKMDPHNMFINKALETVFGEFL